MSNSPPLAGIRRTAQLICCLYGNCATGLSLHGSAHCFLHCTGNTCTFCMNPTSVHLLTSDTKDVPKKWNCLVSDFSFGANLTKTLKTNQDFIGGKTMDREKNSLQ